MRRLLFALVFVLATTAPAPAGAATWHRPVPGALVRPFDPPRTRYGPGHVGADLAAPAGTVVRAAGPGVVAFAGTVAYARHVVILHGGGVRTSYSFLATIRVRAGDRVEAGAVVGTAGGRGERHDGSVLHFGLRIGEAYADPMRLFGADPPNRAGRVHLAPAGDARPGPVEAAAVAATIEPITDWPVMCAAEWCKTATGPGGRDG